MDGWMDGWDVFAKEWLVCLLLLVFTFFVETLYKQRCKPIEYLQEPRLLGR